MTKIICLDNDPEHGEVLSRVLTKAGYDVLLSSDENESLEMILENQPKLVLYNFNTHSENRYQLLNDVRKKYPLMADVPFIYLSDQSDGKQIMADLEAGADTYLAKPVDSHFLLAVVEACLRQVKRIKFKNERLLVLDI